MGGGTCVSGKAETSRQEPPPLCLAFWICAAKSLLRDRTVQKDKKEHRQYRLGWFL